MKTQKLGWFDATYGKSSWREIAAINSANEGVAHLQVGQAGLAEQIHKLFRLDVAQEAEIEQLRVTVQVLIDVLVDTLGLDPKVLEYRLEAAREEAAAAHEEELARGKSVVCDSCRASVPATQTTLTGAGVLCDACFART